VYAAPASYWPPQATAEPSRSNWTVRDADSAVSWPIIDTGLSAS
jgi:hypothetical protein